MNLYNAVPPQMCISRHLAPPKMHVGFYLYIPPSSKQLKMYLDLFLSRDLHWNIWERQKLVDH